MKKGNDNYDVVKTSYGQANIVHARVNVYLKDGTCLSYFRKPEELKAEVGIWMGIFNDETMKCAHFGDSWVVPKSRITYVEFGR